jgi:hypothetical protein
LIDAAKRHACTNENVFAPTLFLFLQLGIRSRASSREDVCVCVCVYQQRVLESQTHGKKTGGTPVSYLVASLSQLLLFHNCEERIFGVL